MRAAVARLIFGTSSLGIMVAVPAATLADETPLSKACIFAAAAQLPAVPGLTIASSAATPSGVVPIGTGDPTVRAMTVTLQVQAAGQAATYEAGCTIGNKTPPAIANLHIREGTAPLPAAAEQPKKQ